LPPCHCSLHSHEHVPRSAHVPAKPVAGAPAGERPTPAPEEVEPCKKPAMTIDGAQPADRRDVSRLDDFQVIAERQRVMTALAALTDQYRELNQEISRRDSLKWMLAR